MLRLVCGSLKGVALGERPKVSLTFGAYIKPLTFLASIMISA